MLEETAADLIEWKDTSMAIWRLNHSLEFYVRNFFPEEIHFSFINKKFSVETNWNAWNELKAME